MTILVRTPPGFGPERQHVLEIVLTSWCGQAWRHEVAGPGYVDLLLEGQTGGPRLRMPDVFFHAGPDGELTPPPPELPLPVLPLGDVVRLPGALVGVRFPVLYGRGGQAAVAVRDEAGIQLDLDVLGSAFFMLMRWEERSGTRDQHDRFPADSSVAVRAGIHRLPIVDVYTEVLWAAMTALWPRLRRPERSWSVHVSHDVDHPLSVGRGIAADGRKVGGDLARRRDPGLAVRRAGAALAALRGHHDRDPNNTFDLLMDVSEQNGLRSSFYFLGHDGPGPDDHLQWFDHPWVRGVIDRVAKRGHEVGLHAAFGTYRDPARTSREFQRLRTITADLGIEQPSWGGRQHYLQWDAGTWRNWDAAGLQYDCTLGYAETVGFRTGTCREYRTFDLARRHPLALRETPFQIMDVALFDEPSVREDDALATCLEIAATCRRFGGTVGILWHNDSLLTSRRGRRWYAGLIEALAQG